ncbi:hypothetical protein ACSHWC_16595 [Pseudomonas fluorescens]
MRPPKKHLFTLMLSLCIVTGTASALPLAVTNPPPQRVDQYVADYTREAVCYPSAMGKVVVTEYRRRPRATRAEKLAHVPVPHSLNEAAAPQPLALMPHAQVTLARGMTFKKLLRRHSIG